MSRKLDIIKAATELFAQKGFHATSTHQVAKLAGVSEGIIFYYFKTKEEILLEIFDESFDNFLEETQIKMDEAASGMEALRTWVQLHFESIQIRAREVLLLVRDFPANLTDDDSPHRERVLGRVTRMHQMLIEMIKTGQKDGSVGPCDPEQTALILRSLLIGAVRVVMLEKRQPSHFSDTLWAFCQHSLSPRSSLA